MPAQRSHPVNPRGSQPLEILKTHIATLLDDSDLGDRETEIIFCRSVDPLELLDHFFQTTDHIWIGSGQLQLNLQKYGPQLALRSPYLLYAILSFSASHIAYIRPATSQYTLTATSYYSMSLEAYSTTLRSDFEDTNVDALFACCTLLNLIAFNSTAAVRPDPDAPSRNDKLDLDIPGLLSMRGFQILQRDPRLESKFDQCIWGALFKDCMASERAHKDAHLQSPKAFHAMNQLERLCQTSNSLGQYDLALESLRVLMQRGIGHNTIGILFRFTQGIEDNFLRLLENKDSKALLLLYYWYSMAANVKQWWASDSAEFWRLKLLSFLDKHAEPSAKALLDFPPDMIVE
ncbi:MAG: hypothetical protein M1818_000586 [Claussenomyces sp. TS43310]|nr:MAG: hypothetical protein M1818_000586 [Claussenomyces sp. TS43310]